jgi:hypothetical protein
MRSTEELIEASEHLNYEIWMLRLSSYQIEMFAKDLSQSDEPGYSAYTHTTHVTTSIYSSNDPFIPPSDAEFKAVQINAHLESFAIHLRSLLDFFYIDPKNAHKEDILAEHYFYNPQVWYYKRPDISDADLEEIKARVGTEIAHLSYKRLLLSEPDKLWPFIELKLFVLEALKVFLIEVDHDLLSKTWKEQSTYR